VFHLNVCPASEHWEAGWPACMVWLRCQLDGIDAFLLAVAARHRFCHSVSHNWKSKRTSNAE